MNQHAANSGQRAISRQHSEAQLVARSCRLAGDVDRAELAATLEAIVELLSECVELARLTGLVALELALQSDLLAARQVRRRLRERAA